MNESFAAFAAIKPNHKPTISPMIEKVIFRFIRSKRGAAQVNDTRIQSKAQGFNLESHCSYLSLVASSHDRKSDLSTGAP